MPINADATVTVGMVGDDALLRAAQKVGEAWRAAGQSISNSAKEFGRDLQNALKSAASDAVGVATSASRINFSSGAASARELGIAVTRAAVSSGRDVETLRSQIEKISKGSLMSDSQVLALAESLRAVTYDAKFSADSIQGIADEAEALGQSPQQVLRFAESLRNVEGVTGDLAKSMNEVDAIARRVGIDPRQLHDQIVSADGVMSRFKANAKDTAALLANLGEGLSVPQQKATQQAILGAITGDRVGYERLLRGSGQLKRGESILNDKGEIDDQIGTIEKVQQALVRKFGKKRAIQVARMTYGDVEGSALMNFDAKAARDSARGEGEAGPQMTSEIRARMVRDSEEAKQAATELQRQQNERKAGGAVAKATSGVNQWVADNPVAGTAAAIAVREAVPKAAGYVAAKLGVGAAAANLLGASAGVATAPLLLRGDSGPGAPDRTEEDLRAGRIRKTDRWFLPYESVPDDQQPAAAAAYADQIARAIEKIEIKPQLTIQQNQDGTITGVTNGKAAAAKQ